MLRIILASCLLLVPLCSGCATCAKVFNFFFEDTRDEEWEQQNAIFQQYEDDQKEREEKSKSWSATALP